MVVVDVNKENHYQGFPPKTLSAPAVAESSFNILLITLLEELGGRGVGGMYFIAMRNIDTEAVQGGLDCTSG